MPTEMIFRLRADLGELSDLMDRVHAFGESSGVPAQAAGRVALVVEELVSNAINHGYDESGAGAIEVRLRVAPEWIEIALDDDGRPFNPFVTPTPDLDQPIEDRPIGGLGLHLVKSMTRTQRYQREHDRNRVDLTVQLDG